MTKWSGEERRDEKCLDNNPVYQWLSSKRPLPRNLLSIVKGMGSGEERGGGGSNLAASLCLTALFRRFIRSAFTFSAADCKQNARGQGEHNPGRVLPMTGPWVA